MLAADQDAGDGNVRAANLVVEGWDTAAGGRCEAIAVGIASIAPQQLNTGSVVRQRNKPSGHHSS